MKEYSLIIHAQSGQASELVQLSDHTAMHSQVKQQESKILSLYKMKEYSLIMHV